MQKNVLVIEDISLVGRCSLLAALPVFSACGIRAVPLPTALLSSHTGGFKDPHRRDLTEDMALSLTRWQGIPLRFDAIHVGYLAGAHQLPLVIEAIEAYRTADTLLFVDPVMGDWGKRYSYCDDELLTGFRELCARADLVFPNRTEAALLLEQPYDKKPDSPQKLLAQLQALQALGAKAALITGISAGDGYIGSAALGAGMTLPGVALAPQVKGAWPGTGDLFASAVEAALLKGLPLGAACETAAAFIHRCLKDADPDPKQARFGAPFEPQLCWLAGRLGGNDMAAG